MSTLPRYAGYRWLRESFALIAPDHKIEHLIGSVGARTTHETFGDTQLCRVSRQYEPGDEPLSQLVFALKYQGVNLPIMKGVFSRLSPNDVAQFVLDTPTGKYHRLIWFYAEFLTGQTVPIPDVTQGGYVDALDPDKYFTGPATNSKRHRVRNNLLGTPEFCPVIRRTDAITAFEASQLDLEITDLINHFDPEMISRSVNYLYSKETKASYDIEREDASSQKIRRFLTTLSQAGRVPLSHEQMVRVQNTVVEPRFAEEAYRNDRQVYIGETRRFMGQPYENIHFVAARAQDVQSMMDGLVTMAASLRGSEVPAAVQAAALSFGFVYIHPFEDGNGRTHRYLIHDTLAANRFTPEGVVIPVSTAILGDMRRYDESLEAFSKDVMTRVDYNLDEDGNMTVNNDLSDLYRYPDLTQQTEYLCWAIKKAVEEDFVAELSYLSRYDRAREAIAQIVDLPNRDENLLLNCLAQNCGVLSLRKREKHFNYLSDAEIRAIEDAFQFAWELQSQDVDAPAPG